MLRKLSIFCVLTALVAAPAAWAGGSGDCNGDGNVDRADAAIAKDAVGTVSGDSGFIPEADVDGDGVITVADLTAILNAHK